MTEQRSTIVLINGASSAGKSTLAKAFQAQVDIPFLRFSLDLLMFGGEVLPERRDVVGPFSRPAMRPKLFEGYYGCLAALAAAGSNVVIDHIVETPEQLNLLRDVLAPFDVFYVGLRCPPHELSGASSSAATAGSAMPDVTTSLPTAFGPYDAELDGTLPAEANAATLIAAWKARRSPGVFGAHPWGSHA